MNEWQRRTEMVFDALDNTGVRRGSRRVGAVYMAGEPRYSGDQQRYHTNPTCQSVRESQYVSELPLWEHDDLGTYLVRGPNLLQQKVIGCQVCDRPEPKHGTETRYRKYGCRCEACRLEYSGLRRKRARQARQAA